MPNLLAFFMLGFWPIVTAVLFQRLPRDRALIWTLLLGYLFLPEPPTAFDLPLLPPLYKHNIPALSALVVIALRDGLPGPLLPKSPVGRGLTLVFILSPLATAAANGDVVSFGRVYLPGLSIKDAIALVLQQFMLLIPFFLARLLLVAGASQKAVLEALMKGGLVYSVLMLIEIRLSPQLNLWVYGYYQHYFGQSVRFGGYRPVVFLYHGLWVAFFCMTAVLSSFALWHLDKTGPRLRYAAAALYLSAVLFLAKSAGAAAMAMVGVPMVALLGRRLQVYVAFLLAIVALGYPLLKGADLIPQDQIIGAIEQLDEERAASLEFRLNNESILLEHAQERPLLGWGNWGRNQLWDPATGLIATVTDGRWIIALGMFGWVGFLAEFGLLFWPIVLMRRKTRELSDDQISPYISPLTVLLALNMLDLLPNATLTSLTFMIAGALTGYAEQGAHETQSEGAQSPLPDRKSGLKWQSIL